MLSIYSETILVTESFLGKRKREVHNLFLPVEIWAKILPYLPFDDFLAFRSTCKAFRLAAGRRKFFLRKSRPFYSGSQDISGIAINENIVVVTTNEPPSIERFVMERQGKKCIFEDDGSERRAWPITCIIPSKWGFVGGSKDNSLIVGNILGPYLNLGSAHASAVSCLAIFGDYVASGSYDGTVRLWKNVEGEDGLFANAIEIPALEASFYDPDDAGFNPPRVTALSPFGDLLAIGYESGTIRLVNDIGAEVACEPWDYAFGSIICLVSFENMLICLRHNEMYMRTYNDKLEPLFFFGCECNAQFTTLDVFEGNIIAGTKDGRITKFDKTGKRILDCIAFQQIGCRAMTVSGDIALFAQDDGWLFCGSSVTVPEEFLF